MSQFFVKLSAVIRSNLLKLAYQLVLVFFWCLLVARSSLYGFIATLALLARLLHLPLLLLYTTAAVLVLDDYCPVYPISQAGRQCGSVKLQMRVSYSKHQTLMYSLPLTRSSTGGTEKLRLQTRTCSL